MPVRHPRETKRLCIVTNFETDIYMAMTTARYHVRTVHGILIHVASGLFSCRVATGLLAFSSRQFESSIDHRPRFFSPLVIVCSICPSCVSVAGGECRPRSKAPCMPCCLCCVDAAAETHPPSSTPHFNEQLFVLHDGSREGGRKNR